MKDLEKNQSTETKQEGQDRITDPVDDVETELPAPEPGLWERIRIFLKNAQPRLPEAKRELAKDRTRSLALLIGGTVGAMLLFIGVFSTPTVPTGRERNSRASANLGRVTTANEAIAPRASVTPLLNADIRSDNGDSDQLSSADIQGTSRASAGSGIPNNQIGTRVSTVPARQPRSLAGSAAPQGAASDPAAYRLNSRTGTPTYSYDGPPPSTAAGPASRAVRSGTPSPTDSRSDSPSSIVFVRPAESPDSPIPAGRAALVTTVEGSLLPPGTRLLARMEAAATTAVKMPVVASIEYHYERNGRIVIPAGTKVFGEIQQASPDGHMNVRFNTLQMPNGREEKIEGIGVALDQKPLKGEVSGKNTGKKILSQTLSGVGTIAAYAVGAGGAGLGRTITGETLLRDRVASNIALAGEQELMSTAYSQNISVTLPANTRFYVVLQKSAVESDAPPPAIPAAERNRAEIPTVEELRELMDLRREINRMYQESRASSGKTRP